MPMCRQAGSATSGMVRNVSQAPDWLLSACEVGDLNLGGPEV